MANDKVSELFIRLEAATRSGKVDWQKSNESGEFVASFPNYSVVVGTETYMDDNTGEPDRIYKLTILDQMGDVVEVIYPGTLASLGLYEPWQQLRELHESARRKAMGVERALDEILESLPDVKPAKALDDDVPF